MRRYRVRMTDLAERDTRENHAWWAKNRSEQQATNWLNGVREAILSLNSMPERHGFAEERELMQIEIRQMGYGVGSRPTHRIVYQIINDEVIVYRVRAARQDALRIGELASR